MSALIDAINLGLGCSFTAAIGWWLLSPDTVSRRRRSILAWLTQECRRGSSVAYWVGGNVLWFGLQLVLPSLVYKLFEVEDFICAGA